MNKEIRSRGIERLGWMTLVSLLLSSGSVFGVAHYIITSYTQIKPAIVRASNVNSQAATNGQALLANGSGGATFGTVATTANLQSVMGTAPNATSTNSVPMILNPAAGTAFQATTANYNPTASLNASASAAALNLVQTRGSAGAGVVQNTLSVTRSGGGSDTDNSALVFVNDNSGAATSTPLIDLQSQGAGSRFSVTKAGDVTVPTLASSAGLRTDGAGLFQTQYKSDASHDGYLSLGDWTAFNSKIGSNPNLQTVTGVGASTTNDISTHNIFMGSDDAYVVGIEGFAPISMSSYNFNVDHATGIIGTFKDHSGVPELTAGAGQNLELNTTTGNFINFTNIFTQTTAPTGTGASALPLTPSGYVAFKVNGTEVLIPYYAP